MQFLTVLFISILAGAEVDLFIPSFPDLQRIFNLSPFLVELTLASNLCAYCAGSLVAGYLGDRFGRKPFILAGLLVFTLGSLVCLLTPSYAFLILGRSLQGFGMAGPAVLAYVILFDIYPISDRARISGLINGMTTLAMALAPLLGSYVNLYFNWKGNFFILLLGGIIAFFLAFFYLPSIPSTDLDRSASHGVKTYMPVFRSSKTLCYIMAISFTVVPYWIFIGMSPIFYMEEMKVPLRQFGYYQGALAFMFAAVSLLSGKLIKRLGESFCLYTGMALSWLATFLLTYLSVSGIQKPLWITGAMLLLSAAIVFPLHILYAYALDIVPNTKARTAAVLLSIRLLLTAFGLEWVSYFYQGHFSTIGYSLVFFLMVGLGIMRWVLRQYHPYFKPDMAQ